VTYQRKSVRHQALASYRDRIARRKILVGVGHRRRAHQFQPPDQVRVFRTTALEQAAGGLNRPLARLRALAFMTGGFLHGIPLAQPDRWGIQE